MANMKDKTLQQKSARATITTICSILFVLVICGEFVRIELVVRQQTTKINQLENKMTLVVNRKAFAKAEGKGDQIYLAGMEDKRKAKRRFVRSADNNKKANKTVYKTLGSM